MMLSEVPLLKSRHESHSLQASPSGVRFWQLIVLAKIRAQEVLPTPLDPQKRYEWARRSVATACFRAADIGFWPMTVANDEGRYFLADTI